MSLSYSKYLYQRQSGRCYLRTTEACKIVDGYLHPDQLGKGEKHPRGWTWEHVIPRNHAAMLCKGASLRLLACEKCNQGKSNKRPPDAHVIFALEIQRGFPTQAHGDFETLAARYLGRRAESVEPANDPEVPATVEEALAQGGIKV